jgi:hypothetical protein
MILKLNPQTARPPLPHSPLFTVDQVTLISRFVTSALETLQSLTVVQVDGATVEPAALLARILVAGDRLGVFVGSVHVPSRGA